MDIREKLFMNKEALEKEGAITIAAFGDSITHGAFAPGEFDYEAVWWNRFRKKILSVRSYVPVNVINAGVGGTTAKSSLARLQKQVISHSPDIAVVCFGLNDVNEELQGFLSSLKTMFSELSKNNIETVFMTPNMLNTYVAKDVSPALCSYAEKTAIMQNGGRMDEFMSAACETAQKMNVAVCDCYSEWKKLSKTQDTTMLLANRINHPEKEMHALFADMLFKTVFKEELAQLKENENAMYNG